MVCDCCASQRHSKAFVKKGFTVLRCDTCGVGTLDPDEVARVDVTAIYDDGYFSGNQQDGYADYGASEQVLRYEFRRTLDGLRKLKPLGKLLELGCAYGFFLLEAQSHFQACGLELSSDAVARCQERGLKVAQGPADLESIRKMGKQDVVVMLDVIEHLPDPAATLKAVWENLEPGGVVYITTGDWGSPLAKLMGPGWRLMTPPQHLYYFTQSSLKSLLEGIGFRQIQIKKPWKFVPLGLIWFQLLRIVGLKPKKPPLSLNRFGIYINLFDSLAVTAMKSES